MYDLRGNRLNAAGSYPYLKQKIKKGRSKPIWKLDLDPLVQTGFSYKFFYRNRSQTNKAGSKSEPDLELERSFRNSFRSKSNMVPAWNRPICIPTSATIKDRFGSILFHFLEFRVGIKL